jgi:hypothetical protein
MIHENDEAKFTLQYREIYQNPKEEVDVYVKDNNSLKY